MYTAYISTDYKSASCDCETIEEAHDWIDQSCQSAMQDDVYYSWEITDNTVDIDDDYADDYVESGDWDTPEWCGWTPTLKVKKG